MDIKQYVSSEQVVWDLLLVKGEAVAEKAQELWNRKRKIPTIILSWPAVAIEGDDKEKINGAVVLVLPEEIPLHKALRDLTKRTKPYALLLTEADEKELRVVIESHHGTRSWRYPITRRGDVFRLGKVTKKDDVDSIGILWKRNQSTVGTDS